MALDFPSGPTNGQQFSGYTYNSAVGAWQANTSTVAPFTISDTKPTNPTTGDAWWNSADGTLYLYYYDGNTYQWVEARAPITSDGYYSPNYIINGGMDIWQRGTSVAVGTAFTYTADRTVNYRQTLVAGMTVYRQPSSVVGTQYCARVQRDSGNTSTQAMWLDHNIETVNAILLAGKTITYSFYARKGANYSEASSLITSNVMYSTSTDSKISSGTFTSLSFNAFTLTTSWQRFSVTVSVPSTATQVGVQHSYTPVGTAGANDYYEITGMQLEEGSVATPFRRNANSIAGELAACQRYYWRVNAYGSGYPLFHGTSVSTSVVEFNIFKEMRSTVTQLDYANISIYRLAGQSINGLTPAIYASTSTNTLIRFTGTAGQFTATPENVTIYATAAGSYIGFSAEL
jgi:hypothetical protein